MNELSTTGESLELGVPVSWRARHPHERHEPTLVRAAQQGSAQALGDLVERHWDAAHRAAFLIVRDRHAAEDITQEAMLAATAAIDRFDRRRRLGPWIHRIVVNRSLDWLRSHDRRREALDASLPNVADEDSGSAALAGDLAAAMNSLEPEERALVVLRHVLDYRSPEIARMLGMRPARLRAALEQSETERFDVGGAP